VRRLKLAVSCLCGRTSTSSARPPRLLRGKETPPLPREGRDNERQSRNLTALRIGEGLVEAFPSCGELLTQETPCNHSRILTGQYIVITPPGSGCANYPSGLRSSLAEADALLTSNFEAPLGTSS
jgi:hypothetical protein